MNDDRHAERSPRKNDLILAGAILAGACLLWLILALSDGPSGEGSIVSIYSGGTLYGSYNLDEPQEIVLPEGHRIVIEDGTVRVAEAPCRDRICAKHAPVSGAGEEIICLPCRVRIVIEGGSGGSYDTMTR